MRYFIVTLLLLLSSVAMAQTYQEVVYLKNGSIIRGTIIEQVPERTIKIQTADGSVFVYQMSEVEKITKEIPAKPKIEESGGSFHWDTTQVYGGFVRGGIALSSGMYSGATLAVFEFLNSISVSKGIYIGAAIGYESVGSLELIPLTLATRVSLGSSNTQPYILANGGIELSAPGGFRNIGYTYAFGFGVKGFVTPAVALTFDLGYQTIEGVRTDIHFVRFMGGVAF